MKDLVKKHGNPLHYGFAYMIGLNEMDCIEVEYDTMTDSKFSRIWVEIGLVYHNCPIREATVFRSYSEAKGALDEIKARRDEITFQNASVLGSLIDGNKLDIDALKIYALQPVEVTEDDE